MSVYLAFLFASMIAGIVCIYVMGSALIALFLGHIPLFVQWIPWILVCGFTEALLILGIIFMEAKRE